MPSLLGEEEEVSLWKTYRVNPNIELRNKIVLAYSWLVKSIVRRAAAVSGSYVDAEDLMSYGMLGLIKAVEKFDPDKGVTFETFATYRVRGEVIDYMRRNDWVPRGVRKRAQEVDRASSEFLSELGRDPTEEELAKKLGINKSEISQTLSHCERFNLISFEELVQDAANIESLLASDESPEGSLQESELIQVLTRAIDALSERERLVISLYYYEELTLKEISAVIGVSESRVSQIHTKAVASLKKSLAEYVKG
jgi:RNA polymerase sigma factor for flagellar operon FliA